MLRISSTGESRRRPAFANPRFHRSIERKHLREPDSGSAGMARWQEISIARMLVRVHFGSGFALLKSQVVGRGNGEDILVAAYQQQPFKQSAALILQKGIITPE